MAARSSPHAAATRRRSAHVAATRRSWSSMGGRRDRLPRHRETVGARLGAAHLRRRRHPVHQPSDLRNWWKTRWRRGLSRNPARSGRKRADRVIMTASSRSNSVVDFSCDVHPSSGGVSLAGAERMVRHHLAFAFDADPDTFQVAITPEIDPALSAELREAREKADAAAELQRAQRRRCRATSPGKRTLAATCPGPTSLPCSACPPARLSTSQGRRTLQRRRPRTARPTGGGP
jgi:hypothetical protein